MSRVAQRLGPKPVDVERQLPIIRDVAQLESSDNVAIIEGSVNTNPNPVTTTVEVC